MDDEASITSKRKSALAYGRALHRLREENPKRFDTLLKEERVKLNLPQNYRAKGGQPLSAAKLAERRKVRAERRAIVLKLRDKDGLTFAQIGKRLGLSGGFIWAVYHGKRGYDV